MSSFLLGAVSLYAVVAVSVAVPIFVVFASPGKRIVSPRLEPKAHQVKGAAIAAVVNGLVWPVLFGRLMREGM